MGSLHHVIIGAGPAGLSAIETIRSLDNSCEITLVGDEPPYSRMALPYYLAGNIEQKALCTGDDRWFASRRIKHISGRRVVAVEASNRRLRLDDGSSLSYSNLLVATGSRPTRPPIPGSNDPGVLNMWNLADARSFLERPGREVVILGAGFIGLIILDALVKRGANVTFVEVASRILPRMLDRDGSEVVEGRLAGQGVEFVKDATVEKIDRDGSKYRLKVAGGSSLECDLVIMATGIQPNIEFLRESGVRIDQGVLVDQHLQSSVENIYAAGDVAQGQDLLTGERVVHAIQPTAVDHGRVAGANMAGKKIAYQGSLSMNILDALGVEACSFGLWEDNGREGTKVVNRSDGIYRKYVWERDRMVGAILVGPSAAVSGVNDVGMLRGLIQAQISLGPWKDYLKENPLDLRRPYLASGAAGALLDSTLLATGPAKGGSYRPSGSQATRGRSPHHRTFTEGAD